MFALIFAFFFSKFVPKIASDKSFTWIPNVYKNETTPPHELSTLEKFDYFHPPLAENVPGATSMAIILALISFLGIIMNKLLLSAIRSDHKLYSMTSNFVCLADLGNSLNGLIMMILVLSQGYIPSLGCQITVLLHVIVLVLGSSHVGEVHKPGAPEKDAAKDRSSIHKKSLLGNFLFSVFQSSFPTRALAA